jgi:adenylate cyclase class 2
MLEIEVKFYVENLKAAEARLQALRARVIQPRQHETNIRFDTKRRSLRKQGQVLRLRQDDKARLTFKGPSERDSNVLKRVEIEFVVEDHKKAGLFLEALGYEQALFYEKFRKTYALGGTHIMLDELPFGKFVEIEGRSPHSIRRIADKLGLNWDSAIAASYQALFEHVCKTRKLTIRDLSFRNFGKLKIKPEDLGVIPADR